MQRYISGSRFLLVLAAAVATAPAFAQDAAAPILGCRSVVSTADRLACFDREAAALAGAISAGQVAITGRRQAQEDQRATFGLPAAAAAAVVVAKPSAPLSAPVAPAATAAIPTAAAAPTAAVPERLESITTSIVEAIPTVAGFFVLQLGDGSIWRTTEPSRALRPRPGDGIVISRAALGSFMAKVDGGRPVRIKRMR